MAGSPGAKWGLVIFAFGMVLLLLVFFLSYGLFSSTARLLEQAESAPAQSLPPLSRVLATSGMRLGFLFVMGYVSSLIAGKGLSLYGAFQRRNESRAEGIGSDSPRP